MSSARLSKVKRFAELMLEVSKDVIGGDWRLLLSYTNEGREVKGRGVREVE